MDTIYNQSFKESSKNNDYELLSISMKNEEVKAVWLIQRSKLGRHYINSITYWNNIITSNKIKSYKDDKSFNKAINKIQTLIDKK